MCGPVPHHIPTNRIRRTALCAWNRRIGAVRVQREVHLTRRNHPIRLHVTSRKSASRATHLPQSKDHPAWNLLLDLVEVIVNPVRPHGPHAPVDDTLGAGGTVECGSRGVGRKGRAPEIVVKLHTDGFDGFRGRGPCVLDRCITEVLEDIGCL